MENKLSNLIPFFQNAPEEIDRAFENKFILKNVSKGQFIAMEGEDCKYLPIVKSGTIRIYFVSQNGLEMTLYRITKGESCILTISCLLTNKMFPALAFTESDCEIILIESKILKLWINKFELWREFVFDYMSRTIFKVLSLLEDSKFSRTEFRLIEFLQNQYEKCGIKLKITHQFIASEIGTSREVVSRILKELESDRVIKLSRGIISILNPSGLSKKNLFV